MLSVELTWHLEAVACFEVRECCLFSNAQKTLFDSSGIKIPSLHYQIWYPFVSGLESIQKEAVYSGNIQVPILPMSKSCQTRIIVPTEFIAGFSTPAPYIELSGTRSITHKGDMFSVSKSGLLSVYFNGIAKENDTTKTYCDSKNTVYKLFFKHVQLHYFSCNIYAVLITWHWTLNLNVLTSDKH